MSRPVLISWGGFEGHEPRACAELFAGLLEAEGCEVRVVHELRCLRRPERLADYSLFVPVWTDHRLTPRQEQGLLQAVRQGLGCAGWHGMADAFRRQVGYQFLVGGQFVAHPGGLVDYEVELVDHEHPITRGLPDFTLHSEQYYLHVDPAVRILARTTFRQPPADLPWIQDVAMPVAWTKTFGSGRVFFASVGHQRRDFEDPTARELVKRGLLWAMRS